MSTLQVMDLPITYYSNDSHIDLNVEYLSRRIDCS